MLHVGALATDFRMSSIKMRDVLYLEKERLAGFIQNLPADTPIREIVVLCTCNRIEIYYVCNDHAVAADWLTQFLAGFHNVPLEKVKSTLVNYRCADAVRHIFRVASGVESMVFGEHEILGQIRDAYFFCRDNDTTDSYLNRLFQQAIATGKLVRSRTDAGKGSLSVSSIAVEAVLEKNSGNLDMSRIMIIGLGTMGLRAVKRLASKNPQKLGLCNRTDQRAALICEKFNAEHVLFADFKKKLCDYDCIICATSSQNYILTAEDLLFDSEMREKPLMVIDLGAPRNVDPAISTIQDVMLVCVDDLRATADRHLQEREHEIGEIECIIDEQVAEFTRWYRYRNECECSQKFS
jgi:glutamyl-tRNA reductase